MCTRHPAAGEVIPVVVASQSVVRCPAICAPPAARHNHPAAAYWPRRSGSHDVAVRSPQPAHPTTHRTDRRPRSHPPSSRKEAIRPGNDTAVFSTADGAGRSLSPLAEHWYDRYCRAIVRMNLHNPPRPLTTNATTQVRQTRPRNKALCTTRTTQRPTWEGIRLPEVAAGR